jgi:glycosidase
MQFNRRKDLYKTVLYEVNIRQYTNEGTFAAFEKHIPRLKQMGITTLWLMPITPISKKVMQGTLGSYYACSSYTSINPEYGTLADFKQLVTTVHQHGMNIIIDWVANHTGFDHHWTKEHKDFSILDEEGNFTERNGWHDVIDLNYNNSSMQQAMIEAMQYWIKTCDIDGFRCDMAHLVPLSFWQKARTICDATKPNMLWLAECDEANYHQVFDISYAWDWMHKTIALGNDVYATNSIYNILHNYKNYTQETTSKLFFTSNHDENSWNGTEYEKYGKNALPLAVFSFLWQGTTLVYSGQEVANNKRLQFFDKDYIEWNYGNSLVDFYTLMAQVKQSDAVSIGATFILPSSQPHCMAFTRSYAGKTTLVLFNFGNNYCSFAVNNEAIKGKFKNIFSSFTFDFSTSENFQLSPNSYLVYSSE